MTGRETHPRHEVTGSGPVAVALRTGPFEVALRAAIDARGLPLERLRSRLAERGLNVGIATLSYWQRGLRRPERPESLRVLAALEEILLLPRHSLTALLGSTRSRAGRRPHPYGELMSSAGGLDALLSELDSPAAGKLGVVCQYDTVTVGAHREAVSIATVMVVRAFYDGVDRALMISHAEPGTDMGRAEMLAVDGCRIGRVRLDQGEHVLVAEMLFDQSLRAGETHPFSCEFRGNSRVESLRQVCAFRFPAGQYVLRVCFDPDALPVQCHRFTARCADGPEEDTAGLTLDSHHCVHFVSTDLEPGVLGIRWDWT
jgi:hypothetical protein